MSKFGVIRTDAQTAVDFGNILPMGMILDQLGWFLLSLRLGPLI